MDNKRFISFATGEDLACIRTKKFVYVIDNKIPAVGDFIMVGNKVAKILNIIDKVIVYHEFCLNNSVLDGIKKSTPIKFCHRLLATDNTLIKHNSVYIFEDKGSDVTILPV